MKKLNMKSHGPNGMLITFCGLDGCGKTTMIKNLEDTLLGHSIYNIITKQPTDGMRKTSIFRTYMDNEDHSEYAYRALSLMAAADRIQHCHNVIMPALQSGATVISDRYFYSCFANLRARGYKDDKWIYEIANDIPRPDYAFFLDVPVETAVARVRSRKAEKDRYIDMELQHRLREEYIKICKENGGILIPSDIGEEETYLKILENLKFLEAL